MKLHIMSDLHTEMYPFVPPKPESDVLVLAGDIGNRMSGLFWAREHFPDKRIVYVPGNHEFYGEHLQRTCVEMSALARDLNIDLLDNGCVEIDGVRFVGATMWTDFQLYGKGEMLGRSLNMAKGMINDFRCIRFGSTGWMLPEQTVILHRASKEYLEKILDQPFAGKTVVVTHHAPSLRSALPKYKHDLLTSAFASDLESLAEKCDLWIHGHMHNMSHYRIGERCEVVCNPRGYGEHENSGWMPDLVFEV